MKKKTTSPITLHVMDQIQHGKVRMRPHAFYTTLLVLSIVSIALASLVVAYLFNILFIWVKIQTADTMAWGARTNLANTIDTFPWWTVIALTLLTIGTIWLTRRQGTLYRHKTTTLVIVFMFISLLIGAGMSAFGIGTNPVAK